MSKKVRRLRLFAGPNGSGKTTLFDDYKKRYNTGLHINADEIQNTLQKHGFLNLNDWGVKATKESFSEFKSKNSSRSLLQKARRSGQPISLTFNDGVVISNSDKSTAYESSFLGAFIRSECIRTGISFSYESVMSHSSKLKELKKASEAGFRTYLYFICTDSPLVNIERVKTRARKGGHDVPEEKIEPRYYKSLEQALDAAMLCNRAYFFDSSRKTEARLLAEMEEGEKLEIHEDYLNQWFVEYILHPLEKGE